MFISVIVMMLVAMWIAGFTNQLFRIWDEYKNPTTPEMEEFNFAWDNGTPISKVLAAIVMLSMMIAFAPLQFIKIVLKTFK